MGRKNRKKKFTAEGYSSSSTPNLVGTVEFCAQVLIKNELKITPKQIENTPGDSFEEKLKRIITDKLLMFSGAKFVHEIKFRVPEASKTVVDEIYNLEKLRLAKEAEKGVEYYGEVVIPDSEGKLVKKLAVFKLDDLQKAWKEQRDLWGNWSDFLPIFIDDLGVEFDIEKDDSEGVKLDEESHLKEKLLELYPDDKEKLELLV